MNKNILRKTNSREFWIRFTKTKEFLKNNPKHAKYAYCTLFALNKKEVKEIINNFFSNDKMFLCHNFARNNTYPVPVRDIEEYTFISKAEFEEVKNKFACKDLNIVRS